MNVKLAIIGPRSETHNHWYTRPMIETLGHIDKYDQSLFERSESFVYFSFDHQSDYLKNPNVTRLQVLWLKNANHFWISIFQLADFSVQDASGDPLEHFHLLVEQFQLPSINLHEPWPLQPLRIPKPWGAEIWYTGIEERGICTAAGMPLPWLIDLLPGALIGSAAESAPLLLKILDPLSDQSLGDLYFELHEKKIEVYIVTAIDNCVWPDGIGKIRYGFNQFLRANYPDDNAFKAAYLTAVAAYRQTRIHIDERLDEKRRATGLGENDEVPIELMTSWLTEIPNDLSTRETKLRATMNQFTHLRDVQVGDVITVEPFFPHSLQHGVRVIEFQTASYERHILSFAQKVLTQKGWDTEQALDQAILDLPKVESLPMLQKDKYVKVESIANFTAFTAKRISIARGHSYELDPSADYCLIIGVSGVAKLGPARCESEAAFLIPAHSDNLTIHAETNAVILLAEPQP